MNRGFDLVVVGAGIVGLAHALAGVRRGWRVAVVERDTRCVGASVRNFGFVTVTGQAGATRRRAERTRAVWAEVAPAAGIAVLHRGAWVTARRPAAVAVLEAYAAGPHGAGCRLVDGAAARAQLPMLHADTRAALWSRHELRVESRDALPRLAAWLAEVHGVQFFWGETVHEALAPQVRTARRVLQAARVVACPGTVFGGIGAEVLASHGLRLTRLQMLRVRPPSPWRLPGAVLGDLSLVRYGGFAQLPEAQALRTALQHDAADCLAHGVHLIVVQSADGSLVVGDSHHDDTAAGPFAAPGAPPSEAVDTLILRELQALLVPGDYGVVERWSGHYPVGHDDDVLVHTPGPATRLVVVTSGTGASTAFALADEVLDTL
ncbi:TIGR03364 family FAD-dependent oxidoreductase [Rubrivivax sp. RP6-9]|uniref:TIGR03364 family FAD-dependent oxidoreductase n=1 Tax=Rubrivivax sp. RP6-9 TaxID=3415750 RepID=UPI003CC6D3CD